MLIWQQFADKLLPRYCPVKENEIWRMKTIKDQIDVIQQGKELRLEDS